jgi:hypothetical protein
MAGEPRSDPTQNPWRTPKRWILAFVVPSLSLAIIAAVALALYEREYTGGMSPWPGPRMDPRTVVPTEVSSLGLKLLGGRDAREIGYWSEGHYDEGVMAFYGVGTDTVAAVWALRYQDQAGAKQDYERTADWFTHLTGVSVFVHADVGTLGAAVRRNETPKAAEMTCLHRNWIVAVWANGGYGIPSDKLARGLRDAITEHWRAGATRSAP